MEGRPVQVGTPKLSGQKMSASLRERLKKSGRCYASPVSRKQKLSSPELQQLGSPLCQRDIHTVPSLIQTNTTLDISYNQKEVSLPKTCKIKETTLESDQLNRHTSSDIPEKTGLCSRLPLATTNTDPSENQGVPADQISTNGEACTRNTFRSNTPTRIGQPCFQASDIAEKKIEKQELLRRVEAKEEYLRKMNMVKMYRAKNDLTELHELVQKWRKVSQKCLEDLLELTNSDPKPTLGELVQHLAVDTKLVQYNPEEDSFTP